MDKLAVTILTIIVLASHYITGSLGIEPGNLLQYRKGDILLAGLMRVHRRGGGEVCSEIQEDGIQAVETMNMIIDRINANDSVLPGITLGTIMVDTCDVDSHALRRVVIDVLPLLWDASITSAVVGKPIITPAPIAGFVGAASSAVSIQVANILKVFDIPQVSYWSTSPDLSDKKRYGYFFRTVPSDINQATAMIALMKQLNWNYISVVYEDDFYGVRGYTEIRQIAKKNNICIAKSQAVPRNPTALDFRNIISELINVKADAVILFTKSNEASALIKAAGESVKENNTKQLIWIGSDGWSGQLPLGKSDEHYNNALDGSIGFNPKTSEVAGLKEYITNLTLAKHKGNGSFRNPWFVEYITKKNKCSLKAETGIRQCESNERRVIQDLHILDKMQSVADAVLSFVYALDRYYRNECEGNLNNRCKAITDLAGTNKLASALYHYLRNVSFSAINGGTFQFDEKQDGRAMYNIQNYQVNSSIKGDWIVTGTFDDGNITMNEPFGQKVLLTESVCSKPCSIGQIRIEDTEICCWHCRMCQPDEYVSSNGSMCIKCTRGFTPNKAKNGCDELELQAMEYNNVYSLASLCIGILGLILTIIITAIYVKYRDTAIVKASGRELCFFILFGIFITFLNCFAFTTAASMVSCGISRFILVLGPTCMYAGILTKTVRVVIIFQSKKILSKHVKTFLRPLPQIACAVFVVLIQVIVAIAWFSVKSPVAKPVYPTTSIAFLACNHLVTIPILIGLIYPFLLIIICTVLATVNRHVPTGFNETQYIGFTCYTTCVIWLAFLPIFITNSSDIPQKIMTTSVCLSLSAATVLLCLFGPRCYNILFHPETNTQQSVMTQSTSKPSGSGLGRDVRSSAVKSTSNSNIGNRNETSQNTTENNNAKQTGCENVSRPPSSGYKSPVSNHSYCWIRSKFSYDNEAASNSPQESSTENEESSITNFKFADLGDTKL